VTFSIALADNSGIDQRLSGNGLPQKAGAVTLAGIALACAFVAWSHLAGGDADQVPDEPAKTALAVPDDVRSSSTVANAYARLSAALRIYTHRAAVMTSEAALFDSRFSLGFPPGTFSIAAAVKGDREAAVTSALNESATAMPAAVADAVPTAPPAQPAPSLRERVVAKAASAMRLWRSRTRTASLRDNAEASAAAEQPTHTPTIFERLFGKPAPLTLAYASPDDGGLGAGQGTTGGRYDQFTAVYDISAHTVYMPDGTRLEAHSGLGSRLDDPRYVNERMRGATPPTLYDLKLREALFHGVEAIRLIPVDEDKVFGRSGLLAHTYMLGPNGDSNGCVSFRNYNAFLRAYLNQKIKRLAVVAHL